MRRSTPLWILFALTTSLPACSRQQKVEPVYASSAVSPGYASRFPEELAAVQNGYFDQERMVKSATEAFADFPDALEAPDGQRVAAIYRYADHEGQSLAYSERLEAVEAVRSFYAREKDEIRKKVAGAVSYAAKQKQCEADVASPVGGAMDKIINERLEEELRGASDAHALIEDNAERLGPKNVEALEDQSDMISGASYLTRIGVVRTKLRLRQMLAEMEEIEQTHERTLEDLRALAKGTEDEKERARLAERQKAVETARSRMQTEQEAARNLEAEIEKRIEELGEHYRTAFEALVQKVESLEAP
jgi:hypothetical protein